MDTDQKHDVQQRIINGARGIVLVQELVNVRTIGLIGQLLPRSSLIIRLILRFLDHVSSKHIQRVTVSSVELQASREDRARPPHVRQQGGSLLEIKIRLPDQPLTYLKDRQAPFRVHDPQKRTGKA